MLRKMALIFGLAAFPLAGCATGGGLAGAIFGAGNAAAKGDSEKLHTAKARPKAAKAKVIAAAED